MLSEDSSSEWDITVIDKMGTKSIRSVLVRHFYSSSTAVKVIVLALTLVTTSGLARATNQEAKLNPCSLTDEEAAGLNRDLSTDIQAIQDYKSTVASILKQEKFRKLDCLAQHARSGKERFPGGAWKLHALYDGLDKPVQYPLHATEKDWNTLLPRLQRWVTARPRSVTARVALATAYINYGWEARGNGYSNTVSDNGWKFFEHRTATAKRILQEASALPTKCPEWYVAMLMVAEGQGRDVARVRALFDEASKFEPGYYYYARIFANYLLPKWSGEAGATEKFTQEAADRFGGDQGDILYFQVATQVICGCDGDPQLSMARIEKGFEAAEKQYGASTLNLNKIAFLTTRYRQADLILADKAMTRIGEQWDEETWKQKEDFEAAKTLAAYRAPIEAKLRATEASAETSMQTPEGARYKTSFEQKYKTLVQQCARTEGGSVSRWEGTFETLTSVGATGTVEDVKIYAMGPVAVCVYQKLHTFQQDKATPFSPPPKAPYWVRLDLDWAEFAPVASK